MTTPTTPAVAQDARALRETTCELILIEHRLRGLRRWTPDSTTLYLDQALVNLAAALDSLHAAHQTRTVPNPANRNGERA
ncbi:hypothetical protein ACVW00_000026 [Marmoricola sp. URHA0025 HA25]